MSNSKIKFYPIPGNSIVTLESVANELVDISELVTLANQLSIDNPQHKVRYWIKVEKVIEQPERKMGF